MKTYHAIGLMSGTSLDGLDICYVCFDYNSKWNFEILKAQTIPYSSDWKSNLKDAIHFSAMDLMKLHSDYGFYLGNQVLEFINMHQISDVDVVASHGHTIFHQPHLKFTTQIGDGRAIKEVTKLPVIYDFRTQDVLKDGNGAPLVPIGDQLLFSDYDSCLNFGGFSNISFQNSGKRIAFDICPVNIVLNHFANQLGKDFDEDGKLAENGVIQPEISSQLNDLAFYSQNPPKSLGLEWVQEHCFPLLLGLKSEDALATFTEHCAIQMAKVINQFQLKKVLCTGGGAYNRFLIQSIEKKTNTSLEIGSPILTDYKEALIFALMGVLKLRNEVNVLSSATGSSEDHSTGVIA